MYEYMTDTIQGDCICGLGPDCRIPFFIKTLNLPYKYLSPLDYLIINNDKVILDLFMNDFDGFFEDIYYEKVLHENKTNIKYTEAEIKVKKLSLETFNYVVHDLKYDIVSIHHFHATVSKDEMEKRFRANSRYRWECLKNRMMNSKGLIFIKSIKCSDFSIDYEREFLKKIYEKFNCENITELVVESVDESMEYFDIEDIKVDEKIKLKKFKFFDCQISDTQNIYKNGKLDYISQDLAPFWCLGNPFYWSIIGENIEVKL